jgi:hypothetical protein
MTRVRNVLGQAESFLMRCFEGRGTRSLSLDNEGGFFSVLVMPSYKVEQHSNYQSKETKNSRHCMQRSFFHPWRQTQSRSKFLQKPAQEVFSETEWLAWMGESCTEVGVETRSPKRLDPLLKPELSAQEGLNYQGKTDKIKIRHLNRSCQRRLTFLPENDLTSRQTE